MRPPLNLWLSQEQSLRTKASPIKRFTSLELLKPSVATAPSVDTESFYHGTDRSNGTG